MKEQSNTNSEKLRVQEELQLLNEKLVESEGMKSNFLSNVRNEIVNPLTSILGLSSSLNSNSRDPESVERFARLIYQEAFNLDFQIRNIYAAAEIEAGSMIPEIANVDVNKLLRQILQRLNHLVQRKDLQINLSINNEDESDFYTDASLLSLILVNILMNAIEFSPEKDQINIELVLTGEKLQFSVQDYGSGIGKEDQENIYNRFKQLEIGSSKRHQGHGLGLAVTKSLLEMLAGSIQVESTPGRGSTFKVVITKTDITNSYDGVQVDKEFLFNQEEILF